MGKNSQYTRERVPLDWAITQNNLEIAFRRLEGANPTFTSRAAMWARNRGTCGGIPGVARLAVLLRKTLFSNNQDRRWPSAAPSRRKSGPKTSL
jgi:hypothetical protein